MSSVAKSPTSASTSLKDSSAVGSLLKNIPLLAKLSDAERGQLGAYLVEKKFNDKDRIITQGELGLGFYILTKGEVVVTLKNDKGVTSELGRLKEGDYFGQWKTNLLKLERKKGRDTQGMVEME